MDAALAVDVDEERLVILTLFQKARHSNYITW